MVGVSSSWTFQLFGFSSLQPGSEPEVQGAFGPTSVGFLRRGPCVVLVPEGIQRGYFCSLSALGLERGLWSLLGSRATVGGTICPYPKFIHCLILVSRLGLLAGILLATSLGFRVFVVMGFFFPSFF